MSAPEQTGPIPIVSADNEKTASNTGIPEEHETSEESMRQSRVGIPDAFQRDCSWSDTPIYSCDHCRRNGTFDPKKYNFRSASELSATQAPRVNPASRGHAIRHISGADFLTDMHIRRILEGWARETKDPVTEAFQRDRFGKGGHHTDRSETE